MTLADDATAAEAARRLGLVVKEVALPGLEAPSDGPEVFAAAVTVVDDALAVVAAQLAELRAQRELLRLQIKALVGQQELLGRMARIAHAEPREAPATDGD